MADFEKLRKNLERNGFDVTYFDTAAEACKYLDKKLDGKVIGHGGVVTMRDMGLLDCLPSHATVYSHWNGDSMELAANADVYISSVNGIAETGEIVNIDGTGNRVASTIFGHKELYLLVGVNKITPDYDSALWRARNIAAPLNAKRLGRKTPCAVKGDKCYNCNSPERICNALTVLWKKPGGIDRAEVVLINESLGL